MDHAKAIALYQPLLHRIAYNLVRCKEDAEDIVQETFEKWLSIETEIQNTKAYLIQAVRNNCINHLNSLKRKKQECLESIDLSELLTRVKETNFAHLDLEAELQNAFRIMQTKLEPMGRAVIVLKEAFDFDYDTLQATFDKKKDHLRQLVSRAKKKLSEETSRIHLDLPDTSALMEKFRHACSMDNAGEIIHQLKQDIAIRKK